MTGFKKLGWIKRRARRLIGFYQVNRHEAVVTARLDWALFQPGTRQVESQ